jgi:hypothetical protein
VSKLLLSSPPGTCKPRISRPSPQPIDSIVIQPGAPRVVYVPQYDPWLAYGGPLAVFPGWYPYPGLFLDGPGIAFGLGFGIGYFAGFG